MEETSARGPGKSIYRETHSVGPAFGIFLLAILTLYLVVTVGAVVKQMWGIALWLGILALVIIALLANFWRLFFEITESEVSFGFGLLSKSFPRSSLVSCELYQIKTSNYVGYFIIPGLDNTIAYRTRSGPGVKLTFEGAKRPYVISVDEPAYVCKLLSPEEWC